MWAPRPSLSGCSSLEEEVVGDDEQWTAGSRGHTDVRRKWWWVTREALGAKRIWVLGLGAGEELQRPLAEGSCHLGPGGGGKRACLRRGALSRTRCCLREKLW